MVRCPLGRYSVDLVLSLWEKHSREGGRSLALFDCEGAELELLRPDLIAALGDTDMWLSATISWIEA